MATGRITARLRKTTAAATASAIIHRIAAAEDGAVLRVLRVSAMSSIMPPQGA